MWGDIHTSELFFVFVWPIFKSHDIYQENNQICNSILIHFVIILSFQILSERNDLKKWKPSLWPYLRLAYLAQKVSEWQRRSYRSTLRIQPSPQPSGSHAEARWEARRSSTLPLLLGSHQEWGTPAGQRPPPVWMIRRIVSKVHCIRVFFSSVSICVFKILVWLITISHPIQGAMSPSLDELSQRLAASNQNG